MKKVKNKTFLIALLVALVASVCIFSFKFYSKYKTSNTFDFDSISPEGYFSDLQTTNPE